ncbi:hypothetical protein [Undibacterium sp. TS12]|uniref:hypothetical protein n=1 Tax=Undibacterium sp. TS12 TaxID=2908202 RepID=UPI001F4D049E|nr:hypothetical protein [Undibacterium sp. TS12]MCH8621442.1 hypothetical protein [Undibacterium sp. TS12]
MKNTSKNTFKNGVILSVALLTGALAISSAFTQVNANESHDIASVTIVGKRMTEDQKLAFDAAQDMTQTVLISAKRLTAEQKQAMDMEDQFARQQVAQKEAARKQIQG